MDVPAEPSADGRAGICPANRLVHMFVHMRVLFSHVVVEACCFKACLTFLQGARHWTRQQLRDLQPIDATDMFDYVVISLLGPNTRGPLFQ